MSEDVKPWGFELEEYIREGEPDQAKRAEAWQTAIGLQAVDGLRVSDYLIDTAKENIEGKIDVPAARHRIERYYEDGLLQSANSNSPKCNNCTLGELAVLKCLAANPKMTQKELAEKIGCSERTVKTRTVALQERGLLMRENGKRNGRWVVAAKLGDNDD